MKRFVFSLLALGLFAFVFGCASGPGTLDTLPELDAARAALNQARTEEAHTICTNEFASAETKLRQAELLLQDGNVDEARMAAEQAIDLANLARNCAIASRQPPAPPPGPITPVTVGPSDKLKNFEYSVYFDFNSNVISPVESHRLDDAVAYLSKMAKQHKFFIVLTAYCDLPGSTEDNVMLSQRRAQVVRYYLDQNGPGLLAERIFIQAMGS